MTKGSLFGAYPTMTLGVSQKETSKTDCIRVLKWNESPSSIWEAAKQRVRMGKSCLFFMEDLELSGSS